MRVSNAGAVAITVITPFSPVIARNKPWGGEGIIGGIDDNNANCSSAKCYATRGIPRRNTLVTLRYSSSFRGRPLTCAPFPWRG